jgi:hypothetical protein
MSYPTTNNGICKSLKAEKQLRFGLLCDAGEGADWRPQRWQLQCVEQLTALANVHPVALLVRQSRSSSVSPRGLYRYLNKVSDDSPAAIVELPQSIASWPTVRLDQSAGEGRIDTADGSAAARLPARDAVRAYALDFILSFSAAWPRDLLDSATYGVWTYEFGDWERFRGSPPGFWEVYRNAPVSGAMLARLTSDPDVVIPLRRGSLATQQLSHSKNRDQLLTRFTHWPAQVCRELLHGASLRNAPLRGNAAINTVPCNKGVTRFALRMMWYVVSRGLRSWFQQDHWNIGIIDQPIEDFVRPGSKRRPIRWLPAPGRGQFIADPFGLIRDGRLTIFCEYLDYRDGVGTIAAIQPEAAAAAVPVEIGPTPRVHLSYPAVFEHEGKLLCIPETQGAREVALYELQRFPDRWVKVATLLDNTAIVDATVFRHDGLWWMAGATDHGGVASLGTELHLWYANEITGPWTAHPLNPVKTDVASARPAGTVFVSEGILYRPAQDSSKTYGSRVVINRVLSLTTTSFHEEPAAFVEPDPTGPYPDGLHTLSAVGGITLVDGKRLQLAPAELRRILGRVFLRRLRKLFPGRARTAAGQQRTA